MPSVEYVTHPSSNCYSGGRGGFNKGYGSGKCEDQGRLSSRDLCNLLFHYCKGKSIAFVVNGPKQSYTASGCF